MPCSSILMTCPVQRSWALRSIASKLVASALSRISGSCPASGGQGWNEQRAYVELLQLLNAPAVQCPGLTRLEKRCDKNGTVDLEFRGESDVVLVQHPGAKPSKGLACFADPRCDLSVKRSVATANAAQVFEAVRVLQLGIFRVYLITWDICWLESRTRDRKVVSSNPGRSGGRIFFSRVNFVC